MTYYINDIELENTRITRRVSGNSWNVVQLCGGNIPYVERTHQPPTSYSLDMDFVGDGRYNMVTSIEAELAECGKILVRETSTKYLYGNDQQVWLAHSNLNITEESGKVIKATLSGNIDPYQVHTLDYISGCSLIGAASGATLSLSTLSYEGKGCAKVEKTSASASYSYGIILDLTSPLSVGSINYNDYSEISTKTVPYNLSFWFKTQNTPVTDFSELDVLLYTSVSPSYYVKFAFLDGYNLDDLGIVPDKWVNIKVDLKDWHSTSGNWDFNNINRICIYHNLLGVTDVELLIDDLTLCGPQTGVSGDPY